MMKRIALIFLITLSSASYIAAEGTPFEVVSPQAVATISSDSGEGDITQKIKVEKRKKWQRLLLPEKREITFVKLFFLQWIMTLSSGIFFKVFLSSTGLTFGTLINPRMFPLAVIGWLITKHIGKPVTMFLLKKTIKNFNEFTKNNRKRMHTAPASDHTH